MPPPSSYKRPQHQRDDDDDLYGPVTKAASLEAKREEKRKEEEILSQSAFKVHEKMNVVSIETAQVLAAAAARKKGQSRPEEGKKGDSFSHQQHGEKMSLAARAAADANTNNYTVRKPLSNVIDAPPSSGNRGVSRGKYTAAQAKLPADAWGKEDISDDDDYEQVDCSQYDEGDHDDDAPFHSHDSIAEEEETSHYQQHHRISAYACRYGRSHGRSPIPDLDNNNGKNGGGILARASNWLQNQREKLQQLELERQVEEQRRKLLEEGRKQRELEAEKRRERGYAASSRSSTNVNSAVASSAITGDEVATASLVYMNDCVCSSGSTKEEAQQLESVNSSGVQLLCGFGGSYSLPLDDDDSDYSGVPRIDSSGNIIEMMKSRDLDEYEEELQEEENEGDYMTVRTPKVTLTGKGMSVNVDIPDESRSDSDPMRIEIKIVPESQGVEVSVAPFILLQPQMKALLESGGLPQSLNYCKWKRLYSLSRDGDSFETFLRMVEGHNRTVLVVKTSSGQLFGGYADTRWEARHKSRQVDGFYGSAQACLFRFPRFGNRDLIGQEIESSSSQLDDEVLIYKWSGANRYVQLCDASKRLVAFGGGGAEGEFGLCVEDDFRRGTTGHCSTFENEALCEEGYFDVVDLEVWGFTLDF